MSKHTPGPWFLEGKWTPGLGRLGGWVSSNPPAGSPVFELRPVVGEQATIIANAHLIAAAPEMLAMLNRIKLQHYNPYEPDNQSRLYSELCAVIAKAEGNQ